MKSTIQKFCLISTLLAGGTQLFADNQIINLELAYSQGATCLSPMVSRLSGDAGVNIRLTSNRRHAPIGVVFDQSIVNVLSVETGESIYDEGLNESSDLWVMIDFEGLVGYVHSLYLVCPTESDTDVEIVQPEVPLQGPQDPQVPQIPTLPVQAGLSRIVPGDSPEANSDEFENCRIARIRSTDNSRTIRLYDFATLDSSSLGELPNNSLAKVVYVDWGQELFSPVSGYRSSAWILVSSADVIGYINILEAQCEI